MKILYFTASMPKPEWLHSTFIFNRIKALVNLGIKVVPVTATNIIIQNRKMKLNWPHNYNFKSIGWNLDMKVVNITKIEYPKFYLNMFRLLNIIKIKTLYTKNKCDLIHAHFIRDGEYACEIKKIWNYPYVVTVHGSDINISPFLNKSMRRRTLKVLNMADKVIFVSQALLEKAKSFGYCSTNYIINSNGYDSSIFNFCRVEDRNNNNNYKFIGYCGDLINVKRAERLPDIFKLIKNRYPQTKLIIIGDGPLRSLIKARIEELDLTKSIILKGQLNSTEVANIFNYLDILILPSKSEGFPTVIAEALACGVPVVCSNAGGSSEAVGNCGIVVNQDSKNFEELFSDSVVRMLNNPISRDQILLRAKDLTWENLVKNDISVYNEILSN